MRFIQYDYINTMVVLLGAQRLFNIIYFRRDVRFYSALIRFNNPIDTR